MTYPYFLQQQQHLKVYHNSDFWFLKKQNKNKQTNKNITGSKFILKNSIPFKILVYFHTWHEKDHPLTTIPLP